MTEKSFEKHYSDEGFLRKLTGIPKKAGRKVFEQALDNVKPVTGLAGLDHALDVMAEGWTPEPPVVRNYLHHLACRQWST